MSENQRAALLVSQSVVAMIRAMGMQAENQQRAALGQSMAYPETAFTALIEEQGIGWNAALSLLQGQP